MSYFSCFDAKPLRRFVVNFALDDTLDGDIAFHFNVRRGARQVVRNHRQSGAWGREETVTPFFAFDSEATFEIVFFVKEEKFLVSSTLLILMPRSSMQQHERR